jgi:hypothetical protein
VNAIGFTVYAKGLYHFAGVSHYSHSFTKSEPCLCSFVFIDVVENLFSLFKENKSGINLLSVAQNYDIPYIIRKTEYPKAYSILYSLLTDVFDQQTVNMQFKSGANATLSMNAFNKGGRYIRLFGTKGELFAYMDSSKITVFTFEDRKTTEVPVTMTGETILHGHGGGDAGIVHELYDYFSGCYTGYRAADIQISVKNHLLGFAAEKSRHENTVENIDEFFEHYGIENI